MPCNRNILLSIKSPYVKKIIEGEKTVELRKIFPLEATGSRVYVYVPSPVKEVVGYFVVSSVQKLPPNKLWRRSGKAAAVSKDFFDNYFEGKQLGIAVHFEGFVAFARPTSLNELRSRIGFYPPQSFQYVGSELEAIFCSTS